MTTGDGLAFVSAMALIAWLAWLYKPRLPFRKDKNE